MLSSVYLVEYTLHQNLTIEIYTRNFDLHITVPSLNLAFLCRNLDYKPYSINRILCGAPDQFLCILYGAPLRSVSFFTIWGPPAFMSVFSLPIWGPLRSVSLLTIWGPPCRSVSSLTIWEPPQVSFFAFYMGPPDKFFFEFPRGRGVGQVPPPD